ncbi:hypothetical protein DL93DRAFT_2080351, partial [Clavulina sp. PMI_390]
MGPMSIELLPREVLLLVFGYVVFDKRETVQDSVLALATFTAVNSHWRNLAIDYPLLWVEIYVTLPLATQSPDLNARTRVCSSDFARVRVFLERSKQIPVNVHLARSWKDSPASAEDALEIEREWRSMYDLLRPHMYRCCSISLSFEEITGTSEPLLFMQLCNTPILQELEIIRPRLWYSLPPWAIREDVPWGEKWCISPQRTPLQILRFTDPKAYLPPVIDLPWPTLSTLDLDVVAHWWPKICATLAKLPALKELRLDLAITTRDLISEMPIAKVSLPVLERMTTSDLFLWHDISTPSLSCLTIKWDRAYKSFDWHEKRPDRTPERLLRILAEMPIREVIFTNFASNSNVTHYVLRAFANAEVLRLDDCRSPQMVLEPIAEEREALVKSKTTSAAHMTFLPALRTISIEESKRVSTIADSSGTHSVINRLRAIPLDVRWSL